jgi:hypothetical protein
MSEKETTTKGTNMNTLSKSEIDSNTDTRTNLIRLIDEAPHAGFIVVHNFSGKSNHGEIATYTYCKGINYPNAVAKSLSILAELENNPMYSITVKRGTWQDGQGNINPTNRKSKTFSNPVVIETTYGHCDGILASAIARVKKSLTCPEAPTKAYVKLGNGIYQDDDGTLSLRDLRLVSKTVHTKGDYPFTASGEEIAIADAIKADMPVGKYRQFRLDADYESISIGGQEIVGGEVLQEKEALSPLLPDTIVAHAIY